MRGFTENDDVLYRANLADILGLHPHEISSDTQKLARFEDIAGFFKPYQDRGAVIGRLVTRVPKDDVVDHVWRYVGLQKEYQAAQKNLDELKSNLALYER